MSDDKDRHFFATVEVETLFVLQTNQGEQELLLTNLTITPLATRWRVVERPVHFHLELP
jgi:hypothetical protein